MKTDYSVNDLKERVTLETAIVTVDDELNRIPDYVAMRNVWAAMVPQRASEAVTGAGINAQVKYTVVVRKQPLDGQIDRITWKSAHLYPLAPWVVTREWMIGEFSTEVPNG